MVHRSLGFKSMERHLTMLRKTFIISILFFTILIGVFITLPSFSRADAIRLIRDTEIENIIKLYTKPILLAADLSDETLKTYIVNDTKINAFVSKGQKIFLTTGLLRQSKNAEQVIGVIAHEIGHIAGGHLIRMNNKMKKARSTAFISQIMGLALSALTKDPTPVVAITSGGKNLASRSFLNFTRGQEQAADQAAAKYLDIIGVSGKGLLELLNVLAGQEFLQSSNQDPYVRSHPSIQSRIRFMKNHIKNSSTSNKKLPINIAEKQLRLVAKLDAFIDEPELTLAKYSENDKSTAARYARAIAMFRNANLNSALPIINTLISAHPSDPYFVELKGQMLFENGRLNDALLVYQNAVRLLPNAPLIRTSLAHVMIETGRSELLDHALFQIKHALAIDQELALTWRLAAAAYGRKKEFGLSSWSLAEYNFLMGRKKLALAQAKRALKLLKRGSPAWLRTEDLKNKING
tara:strand:+ start:235 stop:1629 length:1395 start_codon:yes stop_codon:yes gene_type:complete